MGYAELTFNDPSQLKRRLQGLRLEHAVSVMGQVGRGADVLDFGAGNGQLCKLIAEHRPDVKVVCYEPAPHLYNEAVANLKSIAGVITTPSVPQGHLFDVIFCLEVFEHLPPEQTVQALDTLKSLLKPNGKLVLGVPNEIFLMALFKGLFRKIRRPKDYDSNLGRILKATLGLSIKDRELGEISAGQPYYFHHLGFDYREFQKVLEKDFKIVDRFQSPFIHAPAWMNSECYFVLTQNN